MGQEQRKEEIGEKMIKEEKGQVSRKKGPYQDIRGEKPNELKRSDGRRGDTIAEQLVRMKDDGHSEFRSSEKIDKWKAEPKGEGTEEMSELKKGSIKKKILSNKTEKGKNQHEVIGPTLGKELLEDLQQIIREPVQTISKP